VFPKFYNTVTGTNIPRGAILSMVKLLGYISDVSFDVEHLKISRHTSFVSKFAVAGQRASNQCHALFAVNGRVTNVPHFGRILPIIAASFDEVDCDQQVARALFDLSGEEKAFFKFFESKQIYATPGGQIRFDQIVRDCANALAPIYSDNPFPDNWLFRLNAPLKTRANEIKMSEPIAVYAIMFYLGSLVRYRPDVLEGMLATKDAWIIERFVHSASITFLRYVRNLIDGNYFVYGTR
jgi:YaaC-like protein